ncbi:MAG: hypothetical protein LC797_00040 [Chloroflexi bacterium]|nr:hypothetical protein [Chloroflexota bacterium]
MPADNTLGLDQNQVSAPVAAESTDHDPEELVAGTKASALPGLPSQHRELIAKQDILGDEGIAVAHRRTDEGEEKKQVLEHR